jgi:hypothetical protein
MKQQKTSRRQNNIPKNAVLLIPEPEHEGEPPIYGVKPGYYDSKQMLHLIDENKGSAQAIKFIADMLETGDPENDGFAEMLRTNRHDPNAIARIVQICKD